ncbi:response regulator [Senegalia massiliensis]|uniref:Stage 0 sporulation protein A homolog n=1 Tax=Senegalia massiliensis TaxID=1720316 RepID=A0A845QU94_9CLOT|nr:response regulator transcription factor [Senegalia massiliensis]NBI05801.1 DNA-binding response regulator [Senegalia massiliensis]
MSKISLMIADDHSLMRQGLKKILELDNEFVVISEASNGREAINKGIEKCPDVILLDINMPKINGIEALRRLKESGIKSKIIILTIHDDREYLEQTIKIGADGYVLKDADSDTLMDAIRDVNNGKTYIQQSLTTLLVKGYKDENEYQQKLKRDSLTKREYDVITLIAEGLNNKEIGERLCISEKTVKNHVSNIFKKIDVTDRIQAAIFAFKNNIKKI